MRYSWFLEQRDPLPPEKLDRYQIVSMSGDDYSIARGPCLSCHFGYELVMGCMGGNHVRCRDCNGTGRAHVVLFEGETAYLRLRAFVMILVPILRRYAEDQRPSEFDGAPW